MDDIAKNDGAAAHGTIPQRTPAPTTGPNAREAHADLMRRLCAAMAHTHTHAARTVVIAPYLQLAVELRRAWALRHPSGFAPRFDTTAAWAQALGPFHAEAHDIAFDVAKDLLVAQQLLEAAAPREMQRVLAFALVQAAHQLGRRVAAIAPADRAGWAVAARAAMQAGFDAAALQFEALVGQIALEWALASNYSTDRLFDAVAEGVVERLIVLHGAALDPLPAALAASAGARGVLITLERSLEASLDDASAEASDTPRSPGRAVHETRHLHSASNAEDEASRAAACVLQCLALQQTPVALAVIDRALVRRVRAMLDAHGVEVCDESGWKLSTSRAAAHVVGLLSACQRDASTDDVLDWLKNAPEFDAADIQELERLVRRAGVREWSRWLAQDLPDARANPAAASLKVCVERIEAVRARLHMRRTLIEWLQSLHAALDASGQWGWLQRDAAGVEVVRALRLEPRAGAAFAQQIRYAAADARRIEIHEFSAWAKRVLEAVTFVPEHAPQAPVVILPINQLLGREFAAVVIPACDEIRLPSSPELPGVWTPLQREALGLPTRAQMQRETAGAWAAALAAAPVRHVLWRRCDQGGEPLLPSPLVQALQRNISEISGAAVTAADPRAIRMVQPAPQLPSQPRAAELAPARLSASAYEDLRRCPYRFFALRMLGLQSSDELDAVVDKRDFGLWLHETLSAFHGAWQDAATRDAAQQRAMLDAAAIQATAKRKLSPEEFLPFSSIWPRVREGYLAWLADYEAREAGVFESAERWLEQPLGRITLIGQMDRTDRTVQGGALVLDYKTESLQKTRDRKKQPAEDTQLAFYAALLPDDTLRAAYINVGETGATTMVEFDDVVAARDALVHSIVHDMDRIAGGAAMAPLGEGAVCEHCAARGLCRKDFWSAGVSLKAEA